MLQCCQEVGQPSYSSPQFPSPYSRWGNAELVVNSFNKHLFSSYSDYLISVSLRLFWFEHWKVLYSRKLLNLRPAKTVSYLIIYHVQVELEETLEIIIITF